MSLTDYFRINRGAGPTKIDSADRKTAKTARVHNPDMSDNAERTQQDFKEILEEAKKDGRTDDNKGKTTVDIGTLFGNVYVHIYQPSSGFSADNLDLKITYELEGKWTFHAPRVSARLGSIRGPLQTTYKPERKSAVGVIIRVGSEEGNLLNRINTAVSQLCAREPGGNFDRRY